MVVLTDSQIASILNALRPMQASERTQFQAALLEALLNHRDEIGDGTIGRLVRDLQKKYFQPPTTEEIGMLGTRHKLNVSARPPTPAARHD